MIYEDIDKYKSVVRCSLSIEWNNPPWIYFVYLFSRKPIFLFFVEYWIFVFVAESHLWPFINYSFYYFLWYCELWLGFNFVLIFLSSFYWLMFLYFNWSIIWLNSLSCWRFSWSWVFIAEDFWSFFRKRVKELISPCILNIFFWI